MIQPFSQKIGGPLLSRTPGTLQINVGKLCNQACRHCHVDASPKRTEIMSRETIDQVLDAVTRMRVHTVDITGGAPEMNPDFRYLVQRCRELGVTRIIDRCNLTILLEPGYEWALDFLVEQRLEVVASLPFYVADNVDRQRGKGVFDRSIQALRLLNERGYGKHPDLALNLVYNPQGAYLPPDQEELREIYRRHLAEEFGIVFNDLFTITNMPISRFANYLESSGNYQRYMGKLESRFNPATLGSLMCRDLISVGYDGRLYDCDFNQMLDMPLSDEARHIGQIGELLLEGREIRVADHCYGCTAGSGSSCGGALDKEETPEPIAV